MASGKRKRQSETAETFGSRMARLRKLAGYSQRSLAQELGVSHRVIAYYEAESGHVPSDLLPAIAEALGVTADQLLGREAVTARRRPENRQLLRKLRRVEKLPAAERRQVVQLIDALVERSELKRQKAS
jgi:transcriptional regulator with XRE-family HTH domain